MNTSFSYDQANRQTTITDQSVSGGTTTPIATYVYSYDQANRVTTMVDAEGTYTYTYDNANELTGVDKNGTPGRVVRLRPQRQPDRHRLPYDGMNE